MIGRFFYKILLVLNSVAVLGLLLVYLAAYVNPLQVSFLSVFNLSFPYFVIINIVFILLWVALGKKVFFLSLIALLLGFNTLISNYQFLPIVKSEPEMHSNEVKVLSYNVHVFDLYHWRSKKDTRNKIFSFIRNENPGIACFQEYFDSRDNSFAIHDSLIQNQNFTNSHLYYTDKVGNFQRFGIATFSAYPIINKGIVRFPNTSNVSIYTDIVVNTDTVRVFNCHLESIRFLPQDYNFIDSIIYQRANPQMDGAIGVYKRLSNAFKKRAMQTELLKQFLKKSPYPIILCGDFNDPPSSFTYNTLTQFLNDSFVEKGKGKGATFSRNIFSYRIDYILYSSSINCTDFGVRNVEYSDHYPVLGSYSFLRN